MSEVERTCAVTLSLPRPQKPLPPLGAEGTPRIRYESLAGLIRGSWGLEPPLPTHAWVRYSLSAGTPLEDFGKAFRPLHDLRRAFGRRVIVAPVSMDHHQIEVPDFDHMVDPETGNYEIEIKWRPTRADGGSHICLVVESDAREAQRDNSPGLDALNALESLVRVTLGAMTVVQTRDTLHMDLSSGKFGDYSPAMHVYGPQELPRSGPDSIASAIELAEQSCNLPVATIGRLSLGLRWANVAFKTHDLLSFWTAIELLADCRGHAVYPVLAKAYGHPSRRGQEFARQLGLDVVYKLRGNLAHDGLPISIHPLGASYLNALVHDLARHAAGLSCRHLAQTMLGSNRVDEWIRQDVASPG